MSELIACRPTFSDSDLFAARIVWEEVFVNEKGESSPENPWCSEPDAQAFLALEGESIVGNN